MIVLPWKLHTIAKLLLPLLDKILELILVHIIATVLLKLIVVAITPSS